MNACVCVCVAALVVVVVILNNLLWYCTTYCFNTILYNAQCKPYLLMIKAGAQRLIMTLVRYSS